MKKIPKKTDKMLGTKITEKLESPETLRAIISSVFLILIVSKLCFFVEKHKIPIISAKIFLISCYFAYVFHYLNIH